MEDSNYKQKLKEYMYEFARYVNGLYVVSFNNKIIVGEDLDELFSNVVIEYKLSR